MRVAKLDLPEVRTLRLFSDTSKTCFNRLMQGAGCQTFPAHVELVVAGDRPDFLYVVLEGYVELYAGDNDRESMIGLVEPVNTLMLAAVVADARFLVSARTCQRARVLMIQATIVRQGMIDDPAFARAVTRELAHANRAVTKEYKNLRLRNAAERLANRLLILDSQAQSPVQFALPYDKRMLAGLLAMTPENLSRAFVTLRDYGVRVDGAMVQLKNRTALRCFARPDPFD